MCLRLSTTVCPCKAPALPYPHGWHATPALTGELGWGSFHDPDGDPAPNSWAGLAPRGPGTVGSSFLLLSPQAHKEGAHTHTLGWGEPCAKGPGLSHTGPLAPGEQGPLLMGGQEPLARPAGTGPGGEQRRLANAGGAVLTLFCPTGKGGLPPPPAQLITDGT